MTYLSPNVGGHVYSHWRGHVFTIPKKVTKTQNCQAIAFHMYLHCPQKLVIMKTFNLKFHPADGGIFPQSAICWLMYQWKNPFPGKFSRLGSRKKEVLKVQMIWNGFQLAGWIFRWTSPAEIVLGVWSDIIPNVRHVNMCNFPWKFKVRSPLKEKTGLPQFRKPDRLPTSHHYSGAILISSHKSQVNPINH